MYISTLRRLEPYNFILKKGAQKALIKDFLKKKVLIKLKNKLTMREIITRDIKSSNKT